MHFTDILFIRRRISGVEQAQVTRAQARQDIQPLLARVQVRRKLLVRKPPLVERQPHGTANRESVGVARHATARQERGSAHDGGINRDFAHDFSFLCVRVQGLTRGRD